VYHGFPLTEAEFEGYRLGMISGFDDDGDRGDAFLVAPDGSRAGIVWDFLAGVAEINARQVYRYTPGRWGVWSVVLPRPMSTPEDRLLNLALLVDALREKWTEWRRIGGSAMEAAAE
jgi:hypothetical protein